MHNFALPTVHISHNLYLVTFLENLPNTLIGVGMPHNLQDLWLAMHGHIDRAVTLTTDRGLEGDYRTGLAVFEIAGALRDEIEKFGDCPQALKTRMGDDLLSLDRTLNYHQPQIPDVSPAHETHD